MFKCNECGEIFEDPEQRQEYMGEFWGMPAYETFSYCPNCGSEEFDEYAGEDDEDEEMDY